MKLNKRIQEMADKLRDQFDCIDKKRASTFLRGFYPQMKLYEFKEAYDIAFN